MLEPWIPPCLFPPFFNRSKVISSPLSTHPPTTPSPVECCYGRFSDAVLQVDFPDKSVL